jgi:hypothetical protein
LIKRVRAEWRDVILVCRKCSKKVGGGFGRKKDQRLAKALRKALAAPGAKTKGRKAQVGVIEVGCFDVCPKKAVTTVRAGSPGTWHVVPKGMPIDEVIAGLGLEPVPAADDD